jgi:hypothetical protein
MPLFGKLPDAEALDAVLAKCQARGVTRVRFGEFEVELDPSAARAGSERLVDAARRAARPALTATDDDAPSGRPSDDELLFGVDGYGLGAPARETA